MFCINYGSPKLLFAFFGKTLRGAICVWFKMTNKIMFYDSNFDKYFIPEEPGWYVQYKTESGDQGAIKVPKRPRNDEHALAMLEDINNDEIWYVLFYQEVK